jgi:branched-subunit amino acid aminotransferase/4-amino-4-deoxychorismate lyase
MPVPILSFDQIIDGLLSLKQPYFSNYLAMYSSWYGGIITDPALVMVPLDDHLVHRGDGVFEAFKCTNWNIYGLDRHLDRMNLSLATSSLALPVDRSRLVEIIKETIKAGNGADSIIRLYVSRGPGSFSANPYESIGSQLYVVVTAIVPPPPEKYEKGVKLVTSKIPVKKDYFATAKNCNYLPNALMTKEAADAGAHYAVSIDENGFLAECATENMGIITKKGEFLVPCFERTLRGITVTRAMELAQSRLGKELTSESCADISPAQAYEAAEIMIFGTTGNVFPVIDFDGHTIGDGRPGPVFRRFYELFLQDLASGGGMLTPVRS